MNNNASAATSPGGTFRRLYCNFAIAVARPYIRRELPGWGRVYEWVVGDFRRNWLWEGFGRRQIVDKLHGYRRDLDLGSWANRSYFFLGRHVDLELQLLLSAALKPGDCYVDIGANEGVFCLSAARLVGPGGRVIAFEPNPGPRKILLDHLDANRIDTVDVRPIGLSDAPATLRMFVPDINSGEGSFGAPGYSQEEGRWIECRVAVGDAELADVAPRFVKIDVEGHESRVIRGLQETLERARPLLLIEMIDAHLQRSGTSAAELCGELEALGYHRRRVTLSAGRGAWRLALVEEPGWVDGDYLWFHGDDVPALLQEAR